MVEFHLFSVQIAFIHMNDFYQLPKALLWMATLLLLILGFAPAILIIEWAYTFQACSGLNGSNAKAIPI